MKIVKIGQKEILKEELGKKLGIIIDKWVIPKDDNFLKLYTKSHIIFLRCDDMQRLLGLDVNLFDEDIKLEKNKIILKNKEEVYRGKAKPLNQIFKR